MSCRSQDGATLFSKDDLNKLLGYGKHEIALICAKFGADLINTSKVTSRNTKWFCFVGPPCMLCLLFYLYVDNTP